MNLNTLLFSGALALGSQNALATSPIPCPTNSPIKDQVGVLKTDIKDQIHNRLMTLDREKHHQVVFISINSIEEYGYDSFNHLGADTIDKCGIGYRGENTGVIVWYGKEEKKPYFISPSSGVSRYLTTPDINRIFDKSKENCQKTDVSCRVDDITKSLEQVINYQFKTKEDVKILTDSTKHVDEMKNSMALDSILSALGVGGLLIVMVGGGVATKNKLKSLSERKKLKKAILNLQLQLGVEKTKYPDWFIKSHIDDIGETIETFMSYSDEKIDRITKYKGEKDQFYRKLSEIEDDIKSLAEKYDDIFKSLNTEKGHILNYINRINIVQESLKKEGFVFDEHNLTLPKEGNNPGETTRIYERTLESLEIILSKLNNVKPTYEKAKGLDTKVSERFGKLSIDYKETLEKHESIFGKEQKKFDIANLQTEVTGFINDFYGIYTSKDISKVIGLLNISESLFGLLERTIRDMNSQISWYERLSSEIKSREQKISNFSYSPEYEINARKYKEESGKSKFVGFDMKGRLQKLKVTLENIKTSYKEKKGLEQINNLLNSIDSEIVLITEYIGLGAVVATLVAQRLAEEARKQKAEAERERNSWNISSSSKSNDNDWTPGGGGGGDGGGAGSD